ncbi:MAG TPA: hypothetical protein VFN78_09630 [Ktedonobacterales bacterium]|nr:hypothetical protein [Ktedonobacterales bacterium]
MARVEQHGSGKPKQYKPRVSKAKTAKVKKGRTSRSTKAKKTSKTTRTPAAKTFHEATGAGSVGNAASAGAGGSLPFAGAGSTAGASPRPLLELSGLNTASAEGLGGALLDLVGEGKLTVAHALAAWTHEQDRLANRAWRRPGGLQRMAGL